MLIAFYTVKIEYICGFMICSTSYYFVTYLWIHEMCICAYVRRYVMYVCI